MSLSTWLIEYFPMDINRFTLLNLHEADEAVLLKWEGLLPINLQRHGCTLEKGSVVDTRDRSKRFVVDGATCIWCKIFEPEKGVAGSGGCWRCAGQFGLSICVCGSSPYAYWCSFADPEPMINWLFQVISFRKEKGLYTLSG